MSPVTSEVVLRSKGKVRRSICHCYSATSYRADVLPSSHFPHTLPAIVLPQTQDILLPGGAEGATKSTVEWWLKIQAFSRYCVNAVSLDWVDGQKNACELALWQLVLCSIFFIVLCCEQPLSACLFMHLFNWRLYWHVEQNKVLMKMTMVTMLQTDLIVITHSHGSARVLYGRRSKSMEKGKLWPPPPLNPLTDHH